MFCVLQPFKPTTRSSHNTRQVLLSEWSHIHVQILNSGYSNVRPVNLNHQIFLIVQLVLLHLHFIGTSTTNCAKIRLCNMFGKISGGIMVFYPTKFKLEVSPLRRHPCFLLFHRLLPVLTEQNSTKVFHMLGGEADFKMHVQNFGPVYFRYCCNLRLCHHSLTGQ